MTDEQPAEPDATIEAKSDSDLGDAGEKALKAERTRANAAEKALKALQAQFDDVTVQAAGLKDATSAFEAQIAERELTITKYKVGLSKGLPETLINRLQGGDEAALAADADELMRVMPAAAPTNHNPRPDPSQGAKKPATSGPLDAFVAAMGPILNP